MKHDLKTLRRSQTLRKNMTKEERHLWYEFLKVYPVPFKRQFPIGSYIVASYSLQSKLAVELDGSEPCTLEGVDYDMRRTEYLEQQGLLVLRISNLDVIRNFRGVCDKIHMTVRDRMR